MNHPINMDAIQEGVEAFLATYPDEFALDARAPTKAPKGAHTVLWIDDFWRGVDMAREALESAQLQVENRRGPLIDTETLRRVACAAAIYSLANEGRKLDYQVALWSISEGGERGGMVRPAVSALKIDGHDIDPDAVDVFVEQIASIYTTGDADEPGHEQHCDPELVADRDEPAGPPRDDVQWWLAELAKVKAQAEEAMKRADKFEADRRRKFPQP